MNASSYLFVCTLRMPLLYYCTAIESNQLVEMTTSEKILENSFTVSLIIEENFRKRREFCPLYLVSRTRELCSLYLVSIILLPIPGIENFAPCTWYGKQLWAVVAGGGVDAEGLARHEGGPRGQEETDSAGNLGGGGNLRYCQNKKINKNNS